MSDEDKTCLNCEYLQYRPCRRSDDNWLCIYLNISLTDEQIEEFDAGGCKMFLEGDGTFYLAPGIDAWFDEEKNRR